MPRFLELNGVWLAFPASDVLSFLLVCAMLIPMLRQFKKASVVVPAEVEPGSTSRWTPVD
jgi:hypothetical protein